MATPRKTVHFKDKVRVRRIPTRASISDDLKSQLWVSKEEILKQAYGNNKKNFNFLKIGSMLSSDMVDDLDGLESSQDKRKRHERMFRAMHSVLEEQSRIWNEQDFASASAPPQPMEVPLATIYSKDAAESADLARERGLIQAKAQTNGGDEENESENIVSNMNEADSNVKVDTRGRQNILNKLQGSSRRSPRPPRRSPQRNHELERRLQ
ncbi:MAG: hypothetical protein SGBAC_009097 [Bacillariaceae sp.]